MTVRVSDTYYIWVNGHRPKGRGHWAFQIGGDFPVATVWFRGTYAEAKRAAVKAAKEHKVDFIKVMP